MATMILDGDILPYQIGYAMEKGGDIADWIDVRTAVEKRIEGLLKEVRRYVDGPVTDIRVCLSDPNGNFRQEVAVIQPYKGNRDKPKPYHWEGIRGYLREQYGAQHMKGLEGDDSCLIWNTLLQGQDPIVCSIDKDLLQTYPIKMYSWARGQKGDKGYVHPKYEELTSPEGAWRNFWQSMLTGDRVDNIPGLYGVGPKSAAVTKLYSMRAEEEMALHVWDEYFHRFGSYTSLFYEENYQLLKIIDDPLYDDPTEWQMLKLTEVLNAGA